MICADIHYVRPDTAEEAVEAWRRLPGARYLAGGTEILSSARRTAAYELRACIDIKRIPETVRHEIREGRIHLGAALALSDVAEGEAFPLLNAVLRGIADRTVRNRLTLGGNVAGLLPYREAVLPLLLADATVLTLAPGAEDAPPVRRERRLRDVFDKRLVLAPGELLLSFSVPMEATEWPWSHQRRTRTSVVDYPLATTALVRDGEAIRFAVTGVHPYPFRSDAIDAALTEGVQTGAPLTLGGVESILEALGALRADSRGSAEYRAALVKKMILTSLEELA